MELQYKVPVVSGLRQMIASNGGVLIDQTSQPYLEWYLKGLSDAGAIGHYEFKPAKNRFPSAKIYEILAIELLDETRRNNIDDTLRRSYKAEPESVPQTT